MGGAGPELPFVGATKVGAFSLYFCRARVSIFDIGGVDAKFLGPEGEGAAGFCFTADFPSRPLFLWFLRPEPMMIATISEVPPEMEGQLSSVTWRQANCRV